MTEPSAESPSTPLDRIELVRDAIVFQVKLAIDGIVDLLLLPVAMISSVISFFTGNQAFYDVVKMGQTLDRRINLFGAAGEEPTARGADDTDEIDRLARRIETELRKEMEDGSLKQSARNAMERVIRAVRETDFKDGGFGGGDFGGSGPSKGNAATGSESDPKSGARGGDSDADFR